MLWWEFYNVHCNSRKTKSSNQQPLENFQGNGSKLLVQLNWREAAAPLWVKLSFEFFFLFGLWFIANSSDAKHRGEGGKETNKFYGLGAHTNRDDLTDLPKRAQIWLLIFRYTSLRFATLRSVLTERIRKNRECFRQSDTNRCDQVKDKIDLLCLSLLDCSPEFVFEQYVYV